MCDDTCSGDCKKSQDNQELTKKETSNLSLLTPRNDELAMEVFDLIRDIRDPEKDQTLEELNVVDEGMIDVQKTGCEEYLVKISFSPTVPHCSLATLIGLCLRVKLKKTLPWKHKLDIFLTKGTHATENEINKQINDKERVAAAMENPNLRKLVEDCLKEPE